jgi:undecaprenyl diphosphate synthase
MDTNTPHHIAIIPDGNRRWAKSKGLMPWLGHENGVNILTDLLQTAIESGVLHITFWAASVDNLTKRDKTEVKFLLKIIKDKFSDKNFINFIHENKIRVRILGEWRTVVQDGNVKAVLEELQSSTSQYAQSFLTVLFAYDGKLEMLQAIEQVQSQNIQGETNLRNVLLTGHLPDVDLVIRTGGQPHWSAGFMMWLTANSEFYFTETLWPDFNSQELKLALKDYSTRLRKRGK